MNLRSIQVWAAIWVCLVLSGAAHALDPESRLSQYAHTAWRVRDGTPPAAPLSIAQTTDGYIWVSTNAGLLRFDGVRFTFWQPPGGQQLRTSDLSRLYAAQDGSLWIASATGLSQVRAGIVENHSLPAGYPLSLTEDAEQHIWVTLDGLSKGSALGSRRLCRMSGATIDCYGPQEGLNLSGSCCFAGFQQDPAGHFWLGGDTTLTRWRPGEKSQTFAPASLKNNTRLTGIYALQADGTGGLWVGMGIAGQEGGLQHFVDGVWKPFKTRDFDSSQLVVQDVLRDRHGALWVGTLNDGIYRLYGDSVDHFRASDGLSSDFVLCLMADREDNLWVLTSQGVDQLRDQRVRTLSRHEGVSADEVDSVIAGRDGSIYAATAAGLNTLRPNSKVFAEQFPHHQITSMLEDRSGRLWFGVEEKMQILEGNRARTVTYADGADLGLVTDIAQDPAGDVWLAVSADPRKLVRVRGDKVIQVLPSPEIPEARKIAADSQGGLWLGLMNGDLARYRDGHIQRYSYATQHETAPGANSLVNQIEVLPDGRVLAATGYGLIGWDNGTQRALTTRNGLPCRSLYSLVFDLHRDLWLSGNCGYVRITAHDLAKWWSGDQSTIGSEVFDALDGAHSMWVPFRASARASNGLLYFATQAGVQVIDPNRVDRNEIEAPVYIENVIANHRTYPAQPDLRLPALTRDVELDYTALRLTVPQKIAFRYRLEGHDREWVSSGHRRQAFYTDLAPGSYRFHVIASNSDGSWNERGATLAFTIPPRFYQTQWFFVLIILAAVGLVWSLFLLRLRQVKASLRARLGERITERERIARELHDTFLQGVQGLVLKFQQAMEEIPVGTQARRLMEEALDRADEVITEGRDRVVELRSTVWQRDELPEAIAARVKELAADGTHKINFRIDGEPFQLDSVIGEELQRIGNEALSNACRHSGAAVVTVTLRYSRKRISLEIADDGRGFDTAAARNTPRKGHFGILGLYERAKRVGGKLEIDSKPNVGTLVRIEVGTRFERWV